MTLGQEYDDLKKFFFRHIHSTDSPKLSDHFTTLVQTWNEQNHGESILAPILHPLQNDQVSPIYYIKFLARKHGLPSSFSSILLRSFCSTTPPPTDNPTDSDRHQELLLAHKLKLAQTIQYCIAKDHKFLNYSQCTFALETFFSFIFPTHSVQQQQQQPEIHRIIHENATVQGKLISQIFHHFIQSISFKLDHVDNDNSDHLSVVAPTIEKYLEFVSISKRLEVLDKLQAHRENSLNKTADTRGNSLAKSEDLLSQLSKNLTRALDNQGGKVYGSGRDVLFQTSSALTEGKSANADVVKTQQVVMTAHKQNVSEKTEIQTIALSNALEGNRNKGAERSYETQVSPARIRIYATDRSWRRTTWGDISKLHSKAIARETIKNDDLQWLTSKCKAGFSLANTLVGFESMIKIANIFAIISDYQEIPGNVIDSLAHSFFDPQRSPSYDTPRSKLLLCFEKHSQRCQGKISPSLKDSLSGFIGRSFECTMDMKRLVWKIFAKNDDNLYESFSMAIDQIVAFRKSGNGNFKDFEDPLDFVSRQVLFQKRCFQLESKFGFSAKLLLVLENKDGFHSVQMRGAVATILEDFMLHDLRPLHKLVDYSPWLDLLVAAHERSIVEGKKKDMVEEEKERKGLEASLIRSILRILDKVNMKGSEGSSDSLPPPSQSVLQLLVEYCTRDVDRKVEVLVVTTLANLVQKAGSEGMENAFDIPHFQRLAYKLCRNDAIDSSATVYLQEDGEVVNQEGIELTFVSALVGQIMLYSISRSKKVEGEKILDDPVINFLRDSLRTSGDKLTRILCAECLFETVLVQQLPAHMVDGLRQCTLDPVADIQVHATSIYCMTLERLCSNDSYVLAQEDFTWLPKLYNFDQLLMLGERNFSNYVNPPIINILESQSSKLSFSDDIFQLLTFILNAEDLESLQILKILHRQLTLCPMVNPPVHFPLYCSEKVEEIFASDSSLFEMCAGILITAAGKYGTLFSEGTVEHAHKSLVTTSEKLLPEFHPSFRLLQLAFLNGDLPSHIMEDFDLAFIGLRLFIFVVDVRGPSTDLDMNLIQCLQKLVRIDGLLDDHASQIEDGEDGASNLVAGALDLTHEYQGHGRKLQYLHFHVIQRMLSTQRSMTSGGGDLGVKVIQKFIRSITTCLIYAAENNQSLSNKLIQLVLSNLNLTPGKGQRSSETNLCILSLISTLVQNNQILPPEFISLLVTQFCQDTERGILFGEDDQRDAIFLILSKLARNPQTRLPEEPRVAQLMCRLWYRLKERRAGFGAFWAMARVSKGGGKSGDKVMERLKQFVRFWKKSKSLRNRVELLSTLTNIGSEQLKRMSQEEIEKDEPIAAKDENEVWSKVDMWELHSLFCTAILDPKSQISETALRGLIKLNWNGATYCTDEDLELLFKIQCGGKVSQKMGDDIHSFLVQNRDFLHDELRQEVGLLEDVLEADDLTLLTKLENLVKTTEFEEKMEDPSNSSATALTSSTIMHSAICQKRLENILFRKDGQELGLVARALTIICAYPHKKQFAPSTFEAVAFTMVNKHQDSPRALMRVQKFCRRIMEIVIEDKIPVTQSLINFLQTDPDASDLLLKIVQGRSEGQEEVPQGLKSKLKMDEFRSLLKELAAGSGVKGKMDPEKISDLVSKIQALTFDLDTNEHVLDEETLVQCLSLEIKLLRAVPQILNLVATSLTTLDLSNLSPLAYDIAAKVVETTLITKDPQQRIHVDLIRAYTKIIKDGFQQELEECLEALTDIFPLQNSNLPSNQSQTIQSAILECILSAIKYQDEVLEPFLPFKTFKLITAQLQSQIPIHRFLAYQSVSLVNSRNILFDSGSSDTAEMATIFIPNMKQMAADIFAQIYGSDSDGEAQLNQTDPSFVDNLLQFLYSLTHWDFKCLTPFKDDRTKWRQLLLISDFLASFAQTQMDNLNLKLELTSLYDRFGEERGQKLIFALGNSLRGMTSSEMITFPILRTVQVCNELEYDVVMTILHRTGPEGVLLNPNQVHIALEETSLSLCLGTKFTFKVKQEVLQMLTRNLMAAAGKPDKVWNLLNIISRIQEMNSFNDLINTLNQNKEESEDKAEKFLNFPPSFLTSKMTVQQCIIYLETQLLLSFLPPAVDQRRKDRFGRIFPMLLELEISVRNIQSFLKLSQERTQDSTDCLTIFEHVTFQAVQYKLNTSLFNQITSALKNSDAEWNRLDCISTCNRLVNDFKFDATLDGLKFLENIVTEFKTENPAYILSHLTNSMNDECTGLQTLISEINDAQNYSLLLQEAPKICQWAEDHIKRWSSLASKYHECSNIKEKEKMAPGLTTLKFIKEAMMVAKRAFFYASNFCMTNIQILCCLLALTKDVDASSSSERTSEGIKGLLQQVATGSGKSSIISTIAAIKCLQGYKVDVYTSNAVLAERDAKEFSKYYNYFNLKSSHNGDKGSSYISGEKGCYQKQIVYGDCSQFQFDYLRHTYSDLGTLGGRGCSFAILDEVDTMLIDDSSKLARLSSTIPGIDTLQVMYHMIWDRMTFVSAHLFQLFDNMYYMEGLLNFHDQGVSYSFTDPTTQEIKTIKNLLAYLIGGQDLEKARIYPVENVESFVVTHLNSYARDLLATTDQVEHGKDGGESGKIELPTHLRDFTLAQIPKWVDSCLTAVAYQENVNYVVDRGVIKPVDFKTTGVVQSSTNWTNGLHQFLQIKHGLRMASETVTTNFLSNLSMIEKYSGNLVGFTGTLGSDANKSVLSSVYHVNFAILPETHFKKYVRFPDIVVQSQLNWLEEILMTTLEEASKRRGVLIICETIKQAEMISKALLSFNVVNVKVYTKNQENQEKQIERVHPGDVIVATNLAGRGTDIKTMDIEQYGGLHVILSFLASSLRVDHQAFGRTSRQGKLGTGQLIVIDDRKDVESTGASSVNESTSSLSKGLVEARDKIERDGLEEFRTNTLRTIQVKGNLFSQFSRLLNDVRHHIRKGEKKLLDEGSKWVKSQVHLTSPGRHKPSEVETIIIQAVEERWAMFLRKLDDGRIPIENAQADYDIFEEQIKDDRDKENLIGHGLNCFYYIQLGNFEYGRDSKTFKRLKKAREYFQEAIRMDPKFAVAAFVGDAYTLLKGRDNLIWFNHHKKDYKEEALEQLHKAILLLNDEMAMVTAMQFFVKKQAGDSADLGENQLFGQLTDKMNLLGYYLKNIEVTINIIEQSLRRVHCTGTKMENQVEVSERVVIRNSIISSDKRELPLKNYEKYHLAFHDLTHREDAGKTVDQAVRTISEKKLSKFKNMLNTSSWKTFNVTLALPNVDITKILVSEDIFKETFYLDLELVNLTLDPVTHRITIPLDKMSEFKPTFYSLELGADHHDLLKKLASTKNTFANVVTQIRSCKFTDVTPQWCSEDLIEDSGVRDKQLDLFFQKFRKDTISIKFRGLKTETDISTLLSTLKEIGLTPSYLHLKLHGIDIRKPSLVEKMWREILEDHVTQNKVYLVDIKGENGMRGVIHALRKMDIPFILHCESCSFDSACALLENADLEQEDISQLEWKELYQLYTTDRLPFVELRELSARGISLLVKFSEREFVPWISVAGLVGLAAVQATAGGLLIATGLGASVGTSLVVEGIVDFHSAHKAHSAREFSWSHYRKEKAVTVVMFVATMGVSSLVMGAGASKTLVQKTLFAVGKQVVIQVVMQHKVIAETIEVSGKNFGEMAVQNIGISRDTQLEVTGGGGGDGSIELEKLGDGLSKFSFDQLSESIFREVCACVHSQMSNSKLVQILSFYWTLDKYSTVKGGTQNQMTSKVLSIVEGTTNPKATKWLQIWSTMVSTMVARVLASPQFLSTTFSRLAKAYGVVNGMQEIRSVIDRIFLDVRTQLQSQKPEMVTLIQMYGGFSKETAQDIFDHMKFHSVSMSSGHYGNVMNSIHGGHGGHHFAVQQFPLENVSASRQQALDFQHVFKQLHAIEKEFTIDSDIVRLLEDSINRVITGHIIKVANAQLVSPIMSAGGGMGNVMLKMASNLKNCFSLPGQKTEQLEILERVRKLQKMKEGELTEDDREFLTKHERLIVENCSEFSDRDYQVAWWKREIIAKAMEKKENKEISSTQLNSTLERILNNGPADMGQMVMMAKQNELTVKMVDEKHKPFKNDKEDGVHSIICHHGNKKGESGEYRYDLLDESGSIVEIECNGIDSGYGVIGHLTGKSVDELRVQVATILIENPLKFEVIQMASSWVRDRQPMDVNSVLAKHCSLAGKAAVVNVDIVEAERIAHDKLKEFKVNRVSVKPVESGNTSQGSKGREETVTNGSKKGNEIGTHGSTAEPSKMSEKESSETTGSGSARVPRQARQRVVAKK